MSLNNNFYDLPVQNKEPNYLKRDKFPPKERKIGRSGWIVLLRIFVD